MRCFYHHDREAVGTCKSCDKGVCPDCAVDLGRGLACRDRCEERVRALIGLIDLNARSAARSSPRGLFLGIAGFMLALGAVNLVFGLLVEPTLNFLVVIGCLFLAYGAFGVFRALRMPPYKEPLGEDGENDTTD